MVGWRGDCGREREIGRKKKRESQEIRKETQRGRQVMRERI